MPVCAPPVAPCSGAPRGSAASSSHSSSEAQRRAYRIADNKLTELGTWDEALLSAELNDLLAEDFDLSLVGFSDGELDKLLAFVPEVDGEERGGTSVPPVTIPEPPRNPASRTGDLWILGEHRLLYGDSTSAADVRHLMNGERAILFATDPPYLVDYDGSNHPTRNKDWSQSYGVTWDDSSQGAELYDGFIAAAVAEAIRLANSIRSQNFPRSGESLDAAALVWSNAPVIVGAHDTGPLIRSKNGFWLAIPTPAAGKSLRGGRITPGEWERRRGLRLRFVYRRIGPSLLVAEGRLNTKGQAVVSRSKTGRGKVTAPIFLLVPQVKLPKRLDLARDAELAHDAVPGLIVANWVGGRF